jgi:putative ABC transport system substrate-binding protein
MESDRPDPFRPAVVPRRAFLASVAGGLLVAPTAARAQRAGPASRVGVLVFTSISEPVQEAFRQGLRDHGYVEARNVHLEWRAAEGRPDRAKAHAEELVRMEVDVIVATLTPAVQAARNATRTIPIVMAYAGDPVATGFVASLARPGGNITGLSATAVELSGKRIQLLREVVPTLSRLGLLINGADPFAKPFVEENRAAARRLGLRLHTVDVRRAEEVEAAMVAMAKERVGAVIVQGVLSAPSWGAAELAVRHRLPAISPQRQFVESGGLMYYGANLAEAHRRAAGYVARILGGARPGDLPVQQPTTFELAINLKTARTLGVAIPASLLQRADQVIE